MKKPRMTAALAAVLCLAGGGALLTGYAQQGTEKSRGAKLYSQNCVSCHGAGGEGSAGGCMMMSGPPLLSAVRSTNAKVFLAEVRHASEST
jgi:mono/diheme cytochrome c family protein